MRRAKTPSRRRCGAEKETSVHILCEYPASEKARMQTLGFARMNPEQIKKARLSGIVALGKPPINLNERIGQRSSKPESWGPMGTNHAKNKSFF